MPIISTLHKNILSNGETYVFEKDRNDLGTIVSNITFNILRDSPGLVADVANGLVDRSVLETSIIKDIDKNKYHYGIFREELIKKVLDFMFGYGELQQYIEDEDITDIDGTKYNEFVIKRNGVRKKVNVNFGSEKIFDTYCKLIAIRNGGILNENDSHCRVTDEKWHLRINVSIKPRNISGPAISIRKHRLKSLGLKDLVKLGMINPKIEKFMRKLAFSDATVLFCGKGAAGKTTLMRAFVNILPEMERILVVEADAEIYPDKPYCIQQRIKKENEGGRSVTLRDLIKDGLTMSLDTYCIGEIVGDEAWEFVKASFTGHRGIATIHSESAEDTFSRLLILSKGANVRESEKTIKEMMTKSIDIIFYLKAFKVIDVLEVIDYNPLEDRFIYNRLFEFKIHSEDYNGKLNGEFIKHSDVKGRLNSIFSRRGLGGDGIESLD
ncbi:MAG: CpaF family protein [Clostridiaceae bacterium]|jgi:pilus assembly protein CpaF|nr:CpaF family protein [Clostridiaceae bacterium]